MFHGHWMGMRVPASTIGRYGFARENPGIPLGAFPENTKKSRKVFLKPVEFCIFTHCTANRYKRPFFNCLWRFLLTPGQPLRATLGHPASPSAFPRDQGRISGQCPPCWELVRETATHTPATLLSTRICYSPHFGKLHQLSFPTLLSVFLYGHFRAMDSIFSSATKGHLLKYSMAAEDS